MSRDYDEREQDYAAEDDVPSIKREGPSNEDRQLAMFCHLGGIIGGFIVPLIIWLVKKDQSRYIDYHGKEALNFQLTMLIAWVVGVVTACFVIGYLIILAAWVLTIVFCIMGAVAANKGEAYRYPFNIRMIK